MAVWVMQWMLRLWGMQFSLSSAIWMWHRWLRRLNSRHKRKPLLLTSYEAFIRGTGTYRKGTLAYIYIFQRRLALRLCRQFQPCRSSITLEIHNLFHCSFRSFHSLFHFHLPFFQVSKCEKESRAQLEPNRKRGSTLRGVFRMQVASDSSELLIAFTSPITLNHAAIEWVTILHLLSG